MKTRSTFVCKVVSDFTNVNVDDPASLCMCARVCVHTCVRVCACVRACVRVCVCVSLASDSSETVEVIFAKCFSVNPESIYSTGSFKHIIFNIFVLSHTTKG